MDFFDKLGKSYGIGYDIAIMNGHGLSDIRDVCDSVQDFQDLKDNHGIEFRYNGLRTFETTTGKIKLCKGSAETGFTWTTVGEGGGTATGSAPEVYTHTINTGDWTLDSGSRYYYTALATAHEFTLVPENLVSLYSQTGTELKRDVVVDNSNNVKVYVTTTDGNAPDEAAVLKIVGWK